jgi:small subunit ribosomal protein S1
LEPGVTGLIPLSKIRELQKPSLVEKLKEGDSIQVFVERIQVEERKITLAPADVEDEKHWQRFVQGAEKPSGILAQKLKQALEEKE